MQSSIRSTGPAIGQYLAEPNWQQGVFANDALPEEKAKELQAVSVTFESLGRS